jgi:aryl-alcohol dehydrogenase-like predicted oxidoreductase
VIRPSSVVTSVAHLRENVAGAGLSIPAAELAELDGIAR